MQAVLEDFRATVEQAARRLRTLSEADSEGRRAPGKWSAKEVLGHLIDSAGNNHQRFVHAQFTDDLVFPGYDQDAWISVQRYQAASWPTLIELWRAYNLHLAHVIDAIPDTVLRQPRRRHNLYQIAWRAVPESEPVTLEYFIRDYVGHLKHHLTQIDIFRGAIRDAAAVSGHTAD